MLILKKEHLHAIFRHGEKVFPRECCGLLIGEKIDGFWNVREVLPLENTTGPQNYDQYEISPSQRNRVEKKAREKGLVTVGFFHSHPNHEVHFSKTDLENSEEYQFGKPWLPPSYAYFVLSVKNGKAKDYGAYIVNKGKPEKIMIEINPT